jgi:hypothetical protein
LLLARCRVTLDGRKPISRTFLARNICLSVIPVSPQAKTGTQRKESLGPGHLLRKSRDDD